MRGPRLRLCRLHRGSRLFQSIFPFVCPLVIKPSNHLSYTLLMTTCRDDSFPPHHLIHNTRITLNDLNYPCADILLHIIRHRNPIIPIHIHRNRGIHRLQQTRFINTGKDKACLVQRFRTLGACPDTYRREGCPTEVKKLLSSGRVPESDTTAKAFICRWL